MTVINVSTQDHYDKREDLGNCFETAQDEDPENLLLGFLREFGDGFDLGWWHRYIWGDININQV